MQNFTVEQIEEVKAALDTLLGAMEEHGIKVECTINSFSRDTFHGTLIGKIVEKEEDEVELSGEGTDPIVTGQDDGWRRWRRRGWR